MISRTNLSLVKYLRFGFSSMPKFDPSRDYYAILGVTITASEEVIKQKYYELAKKYHPDVNKKDDTMFKNINQAYQVIGDKEIRKEYDSVKFGSRQNDQYSSSQGSQSQSYSYQQQSFYNDRQRQRSQSDYQEFKSKQRPQYRYKTKPYQDDGPPQQNNYNTEYDHNHNDPRYYEIRPQTSLLMVFVLGMGVFVFMDAMTRMFMGSRESLVVDENTGQVFSTRPGQMNETHRRQMLQHQQEQERLDEQRRRNRYPSGGQNRKLHSEVNFNSNEQNKD